MKRPRREAAVRTDRTRQSLLLERSSLPLIESRRRKPVRPPLRKMKKRTGGLPKKDQGSVAARVAAVFGDMLRQERKAKGLSQEDLALVAGLDRSHVSALDRGVKQPTLTSLWKLAEGLGVPPSKLIMLVEKYIQILIVTASATDSEPK